ncbi:MAG TPA: AAA family ATPase [Polyangia bacterium]|nr:AAA family ATPase [Polyangia bacterium]
MYDRLIRDRLARSPKSVLLLGARQVGKSTLMRSMGPDLVVNLADEALFLAYGKDPGRLGRELASLRKPSSVLIDEVQRLPTLLNSVQAQMDEGSRHRFLLTGSSARKLKRGGANLLPGRIVLEHLDPLTIWELGPAFDLDKILARGALPGIYADAADTAADVLETYATTYLREEVQAEALIRNVGSYARFLDLAAASSGDWINYSKVASDAEIPKETVRRFFQILEDTLLCFRIPPFDAPGSRRRVSHRDRFVLFDLGVRNALLGLHRGSPPPTEKGRLFEHWLALQCLAFIRAHRLPWKVLGYRTDAGAEVDLVIDMGRRFLALECKLGTSVGSRQISGIRSFAEVAGKPVVGCVAFQGARAQSLGAAIEAVPYQDFLLERLPRLARLG